MEDNESPKIMSRIGTLFANVTSNLQNPAAWLLQSLGIDKTSSTGIPVTINSVLGIPEVYNAVCKISGHLAQMPIECRKLVSKTGTTTVIDPRDAGARAFKNGSEFFDRFTLVEKWVIDALLYGNGRLYIERNAQNQPIGLYPLMAENSQTIVTNGERWHFVTIDSGSEVGDLRIKPEQSGVQYKIQDKDVLYLMGITRNGWWGENPLSLLKDVFGLAIAGQEAAGSVFRNAGRPGLILEAPRGAFKTEKDRKMFLDSFDEAHAGMDKNGKTALIHSGMTAHVLPADTSGQGYVDQRQFQRESIAMSFLLESVFGDNTGSTYKSVTERNSAYLTNCLGRWISKIEAECESKLLSGNQKASGDYTYKMNTSVLYVHDKQSLAQYTSQLRQQAIVSGNEVREMHGLPPVEGLDDDYDAMTGASAPGDESKAVPEPDAGKSEEPKDPPKED